MLGYLAGIPGRLKTLVDRLTSARAGYLDNLSAGAVAQASTALSTATWTNGRAANLDYLNASVAAIPTSIIRSYQTAYVSTTSTTTSTGEDSRYVDFTITAVANISKCVILWNEASGTAIGPFTLRLTSTTNLRIATAGSGAVTMRGRYQIIEFN